VFGLLSLTSPGPDRTAESKGAWHGAGHDELPDGGNHPRFAHYSDGHDPTAAGTWLRLIDARGAQAAARGGCQWLGPSLLAYERCAGTACSAPGSGSEPAARFRTRAEESLVRRRAVLPPAQTPGR